jgi:hypothetical protein
LWFIFNLHTKKNNVQLKIRRQEDIKKKVAQDFHPRSFMKLLLLVPVDMPRNDFDFVQIFFELFNPFCAFPLSTTLVKFASPVSLTLVRNYSLVSTPLAKDTVSVLTQRW